MHCCPSFNFCSNDRQFSSAKTYCPDWSHASRIIRLRYNFSDSLLQEQASQTPALQASHTQILGRTAHGPPNSKFSLRYSACFRIHKAVSPSPRTIFIQTINRGFRHFSETRAFNQTMTVQYKIKCFPQQSHSQMTHFPPSFSLAKRWIYAITAISSHRFFLQTDAGAQYLKIQLHTANRVLHQDIDAPNPQFRAKCELNRPY